MPPLTEAHLLPWLPPLAAIWVVGVLLLLPRGKFGWSVKLLALASGAILVLQAWDVLWEQSWKWWEAPLSQLAAIARGAEPLARSFLFFAWPIGLVIVFYKADLFGARRIVIVLALATAAYAGWYYWNRPEIWEIWRAYLPAAWPWE